MTQLDKAEMLLHTGNYCCHGGAIIAADQGSCRPEGMVIIVLSGMSKSCPKLLYYLQPAEFHRLH